jgi:plastocyanin
MEDIMRSRTDADLTEERADASSKHVAALEEENAQLRAPPAADRHFDRRSLTPRRHTVLLALVVPAIALAAVLATRVVKGPSSESVATTRPHTIVIKDFAFHPARLTVVKGTRLTVTNADDVTHTFTARNGGFSSVQLAGGKSATIALNTAGTFSYYCTIHTFMTGTLVVR